MKVKITYCLLFVFLVEVIRAQAPHEQIVTKLNEYCSKVPWYDAYVHTDRDTYIAGEDMWFKVYCADRQTGLPAPDIIAYFELLSSDNRPVIRKRIKLVKGSGPDQVVLPDTLSTGTYRIRAYTNRMKNFMPDNCFIKQIYVFNAFTQKEITAETSVPAGKTRYKLLLGTDNSRSDSLIINVTGDSQSLRGNYSMLINTRGNISYAAPAPIKSLPARIAVSKRTMLPGVCQITLFDNLPSPVAERFIYMPDRPDVADIEVTGQAGIREKISASIRNSEASDLSISIVPKGSETVSISDYMTFGSEFGPEFYEAIKGTGELTSAYVDSLLDGAVSRWIKWDMVIQGKQPEIFFRPEINQHYFSGSLIDDNPADKFVIMSIPGKQAYFQYAVTDARGNFAFSMPVDGELRDIVIQPDEINGKSSIKMISPFFEEYDIPERTKASSAIKYPALWSEGYQVSKIYGTRYTLPSTRLITPSLPNRRFYGKPDVELKLSDYIKLPVMEEIFFEIIPGANLRKRRTGYEITIADPVTKMTYDVPPSLFVDGVRIDNADLIAGIDPEYVEQIDVVLEKHLTGGYVFQGIVNVISKKADLSLVELPKSALRTRYRVFEPVSEFTSPSYNDEKSRSSRIPDFRNTLYWNPRVEGAMDFWTSDVPGEYEISVQGITPGGKFISQKKTFVVK